MHNRKFGPRGRPLPAYVVTILTNVHNDVMNSLVVSTPELARDDDFKNYIAQTLLDLARAGQVDPRELSRYALDKGKQYTSAIRNKRA